MIEKVTHPFAKDTQVMRYASNKLKILAVVSILVITN